MGRSYNFIYRSLVKGKNDLVGHIAYSLYKAEKIEFIEAFKRDHSGAEPSESDFEQFHRSSCVSGSMERYRLSASSMLTDMMDNLIEDTREEINQFYYLQHKRMIEEAIEPIKPMGIIKQLGWGALQSVIGAFIFALILAAIGFITMFKANDINVTISRQGDANQETSWTNNK